MQDRRGKEPCRQGLGNKSEQSDRNVETQGQVIWMHLATVIFLFLRFPFDFSCSIGFFFCFVFSLKCDLI